MNNRDENIQLKTVADKYQVTSVILNELHEKLAITGEAYKKLVKTIRVDSTQAIFNRQIETMRETENKIQTTKVK